MNNINKNKTKGFTLIELLVVILIISILSGLTLAVVNTTGIREKTRDSQRKADLKKVQTALELYYTDNREYPSASIWTRVSSLNTLVSGKYLSTLPRDPNAHTDVMTCSTTGTYEYSYITDTPSCALDCDATRYIITAYMEVPSSANESNCETLSNWNALSGCGSTAPTSCYGVQNP